LRGILSFSSGSNTSKPRGSCRFLARQTMTIDESTTPKPQENHENCKADRSGTKSERDGARTRDHRIDRQTRFKDEHLGADDGKPRDQ
jgi:hypothetical protein